jgi:hypothetical protein
MRFPQGKKCFIGFDAFIDYITRPVAGCDGGENRYFHSLEEYARFLAGQGKKSFSIELETPKVKIGGNNPIMSDILSRFGLEVVSFGAYGKPLLDPVFLPLSQRCKVVSFANPGKCTAYEFTVSKMMNYYNMDPRDFTYENLLNYLSEDEIIAIMEPQDLIVFVNLGEQPAALNIMEVFLTRIFPRFEGKKQFFLDFSDCSHMPDGELARSLKFLKNLRVFGNVALSVNENEYRFLSGRMGIAPQSGDSLNGEAEKGSLERFRETAGADQVMLRTLETFYYSSHAEKAQVPNAVVDGPRFLTGAGDAQNAGFCLGLLAGMSPEEMLLTAVRAGNRYIRTGSVDPNTFFEGALT